MAKKKPSSKKIKKDDASKVVKPETVSTASVVSKDDKFYSVPELASKEGVSMKTIYNWILEKKVKATKFPASKKSGKESKGFKRGEWLIPKKGYVRPAGMSSRKKSA